MASHSLATLDPGLAFDLSDLLFSCVSRGCRKTYDCGFRDLEAFCARTKLCAMPVDAITLSAWMMEKAKTCKVRSVIKYASGVRSAHILAGLPWTLSDNPIVQATISALKKQYPASNVLQKVPLSLSMLLQMCEAMPEWPQLRRLSFDDLLWATASCIAFFAALRGGEFFVRPGSDRPVLTGEAVRIMESSQGRFVIIDVPSPKTRKDLESIPAMAVSPTSDFLFDPVSLLLEYRSRAQEMGIDVLHGNAAFRLRSGLPLDRDFMVSHAERLSAAAGLEILDAKGKRVKISAASWRAGFVMSSRDAHVKPSTMRANGRWASEAGPVPYTVDTLQSFQNMSEAIIRSHTKQTQAGVRDAGGRFIASTLLLRTGQGGSFGLRPSAIHT